MTFKENINIEVGGYEEEGRSREVEEEESGKTIGKRSIPEVQFVRGNK